MSIASRPGSVILPKVDKANGIIACITCPNSFVPSNAESEAMEMCPSCEEIIKDDNGLTTFGKSVDEDANNVSQGNLFISISLVLFAYCIDRLPWKAERAMGHLMKVKMKTVMKKQPPPLNSERNILMYKILLERNVAASVAKWCFR